MDSFEYIITFSSIILGLGVAEILTGISDIISSWERIKFSISHSLYILVVFFIHIQDWWWTYSLQKIIKVWTIAEVMTLLLFPILLFLQARMLFPTGLRQMEHDLCFYFKDRWRFLYTLGMGTVFISIWNNITISNLSLFSQTPQIIYFLLYLIFIIKNIKNQLYHMIFILLQLTILGIFTFMSPPL